MGMDSKAYRLYWIKKVFQDGVPIPPSMGNISAIIDMVKTEKGAVAYVPEGTVLDKQTGIIVNFLVLSFMGEWGGCP